jgi:hypothetical protein
MSSVKSFNNKTLCCDYGYAYPHRLVCFKQQDYLEQAAEGRNSFLDPAQE